MDATHLELWLWVLESLCELKIIISNVGSWGLDYPGKNLSSVTSALNATRLLARGALRSFPHTGNATHQDDSRTFLSYHHMWPCADPQVMGRPASLMLSQHTLSSNDTPAGMPWDYVLRAMQGTLPCLPGHSLPRPSFFTPLLPTIL